MLPTVIAALSKVRAGTLYSYVGRVSAQGLETGLLLLETWVLFQRGKCVICRAESFPRWTARNHVSFLAKGRFFFPPELWDRFWGQPNLVVSGYWGILPAINLPRHADSHTPPSNMEVKNEWSYISIRVFRVCTFTVLFTLVFRSQ
jgi:hypothetical protein